MFYRFCEELYHNIIKNYNLKKVNTRKHWNRMQCQLNVLQKLKIFEELSTHSEIRVAFKCMPVASSQKG